MGIEIPTSVRLSEETLKGLTIIAQRQGKTRHAVMVAALTRIVEDAWVLPQKDTRKYPNAGMLPENRKE